MYYELTTMNVNRSMDFSILFLYHALRVRRCTPHFIRFDNTLSAKTLSSLTLLAFTRMPLK